jgi:hypothetical protein
MMWEPVSARQLRRPRISFAASGLAVLCAVSALFSAVFSALG